MIEIAMLNLHRFRANLVDVVEAAMPARMGIVLPSILRRIASLMIIVVLGCTHSILRKNGSFEEDFRKPMMMMLETCEERLLLF